MIWLDDKCLLIHFSKQQGGVPTFGNWSAAGDTPYTQKFENLRRSKKTATGVYSNPNEVITETPDQPPPPPLRSPLHPSSHDALNQRQRYERKPETGHPRPAGSPLHRETVARRHANPLQQHHLDHGGYGGSPRSPYREVAAAAAASPRSRYRSAGMQTPDRKASSSDGRVPVTPGRSRLKQGGRGFEPVQFFTSSRSPFANSEMMCTLCVRGFLNKVHLHSEFFSFSGFR